MFEDLLGICLNQSWLACLFLQPATSIAWELCWILWAYFGFAFECAFYIFLLLRPFLQSIPSPLVDQLVEEWFQEFVQTASVSLTRRLKSRSSQNISQAVIHCKLHNHEFRQKLICICQDLPGRLHSSWQADCFPWPPRTSTQGPIQSWKTWCPWNPRQSRHHLHQKQNCLSIVSEFSFMPRSMQCRSVSRPSATSRQAPCWSPFRTALEPTVS